MQQTFKYSTSSLLVWDSPGQPPEGEWVTALWSGFETDDALKVFSIPKLVEEQDDKLRSRYLAWIHELGETVIDGKRLVDYLELRPGFSYWWTFTGIGKGDYRKLPLSYTAVRLMALELLVSDLLPRSIILVSSDRAITSLFKIWCRKAGIAFESRRSQLPVSEEPLKKRIYCLLPYPLKSAIYLLHYLWERWPLRHTGNNMQNARKDVITFINYLDNLDRKEIAKGVFSSFYWTNLPDKLVNADIQTNWVHHYVSDEVVKTTKHAKVLITKFNEDPASNLNHTCIDGVLSISLVFASLMDYLTIIRKGWRLHAIRDHFQPSGSNIDLWQIFQDEWRNSIYGPVALSNCLFLNLFEKYLKLVPHQRACFYLQENQGWEMSLIHAWKASGHGHLIGVPHSTIRFWDLRYFNDPRSYQRTGKNDLPMPDMVALNGQNAIRTYETAGYPNNQIVEVEALRFLYLANRENHVSSNKSENKALSILVLGDYLNSITCRQMEWLVKAAENLPVKTQFVVKPHPNCPINKNDYPSLGIFLVTDPISELLKNCDVAYTSNITSAVVDAYLSGIPVVSVLDAAAFNLSPLRGMEGVEFVTSPKELVEALKKVNEPKRPIKKPDYFTIDPELPRWKSLIKELMHE